MDERSRGRRASRSASRSTPALDSVSWDLTELAHFGQLPQMFARDDELEQLMHGLCADAPGNCVVLGDVGVGKTSLIYGLAQRIADDDAPAALLDARVVRMDRRAWARCGSPSNSSARHVKTICAELERAPSTIIVFDDLHTWTSDGATGVAARALLQLALQCTASRCVCATTLEQYCAAAIAYPWLGHRLSAIAIEPPQFEQTLQILNGVCSTYEARHCVRFSPSALLATAALAHTRFPPCVRPPSAIEILATASADNRGGRARTAGRTGPPRHAQFNPLDQRARADALRIIDWEDICDVVSALTGLPPSSVQVAAGRRVQKPE